MPLFGARNCYASMYAMALCWLLTQLIGILCTVITSWVDLLGQFFFHQVRLKTLMTSISIDTFCNIYGHAKSWDATQVEYNQIAVETWRRGEILTEPLCHNSIYSQHNCLLLVSIYITYMYLHPPIVLFTKLSCLHHHFHWISKIS
jgi:hypothetical protein